MLQFMISGKIVSVVENFDTASASNQVMMEFEQKSFKDAKLCTFRWSVFMGAHKLKWANTLKAKGYSVILVCDDLLFFDDRIRDDKTKFSGYAHATEIMTL